MLDRLLASLYSAFDKGAQEQLALRLTHPQGVAWTVADRVLRVQTESNQTLFSMPLTDATIDDVAEAAADAGCTVAYQNPELSSRAADSLLAGSGSESQSNGDHLYVYGSLLWALMDSFAVGLEVAERNAIIEGLKQAYLHSAASDWLDYWFSFFGIPREAGENDDEYRQRAIIEIVRPRNNAMAISKAAQEIFDADLYVREPWKEIFILDESTLSGAHHMQDGSYYTWTVIQPILLTAVSAATRARILAMINRNRAAGVLVIDPFPPSFQHVRLAWPPSVAVGWLHQAEHGAAADRRAAVLSSSLTLSDSRPQQLVDFQFRYFGLRRYAAHATTLRYHPGRYWRDSGGWVHQPWHQGNFEAELRELPP